MNPQLEIIENNAVTLQFVLSGLNVSIANGLRRTILSDIPLIVFRTSPTSENKCIITTNTTRLNNEVIKQRLSCIPIHIKKQEQEEFPFQQLIMEVNVENTTDNIMFVTTEDFVIKDKTTGKSLPMDDIRKIFPKDLITNDYIDFVRLRPKITDDLRGEKIHLTCEFDMGTAKEDGMFNAVSTCSYGFTIDPASQEEELARKKQQWIDEEKTQEEINFEEQNWRLLDAKRIYKKDCFDFIVESIGVYDNIEIINIACQMLIGSFQELGNIIERDEIEIKNSDSTMSNSYDVILENHDYTIGKVLEYLLHTKYYETKMLTFCGFKKMHPHDSYSIIRLAYLEPVSKSGVKANLLDCIRDAINIYDQIDKQFNKMMK
jgi:DNA-directed RNA polymerase alpha subunit